jgi:alkanesulfonate monooxygenase SsuD/methylene tetrahydromethanopterin reductase-like flavin-dependent oxidoreductase (luciferase family)
MLGAPLPIVDNPLRLSEELAMIDCISRGRLIAGVVRGGGVESLANNVNPAYNRERFEEAHDLLVAAWTRPGPFRWQGKHFAYRVVNPWVLPLQKPYPPIMVPGTASPETVIWAAQHRYPYVVLGSSLEQTAELIDLYRETAQAAGYMMGPQHIGYLIRVFVADSELKAQAEGRNFFWQNGALSKQPREWMAPPGYASFDFAGVRRLRAVSKPFDSQAYQEAQDNYQVVVGTPDQVTEKLRFIRDRLGIGHLCLWAHDGYMSHADTVRCIELLGREVLPALRADAVPAAAEQVAAGAD